MYFLLTAYGKDRPGVVAGVTGALRELGGNLEDASMTRLGGEFTMMLVVGLPVKVSPARLSKALAPLRRKLHLEISARTIPSSLALQRGRREPDGMISVYGTDRPGIVHEVARCLARRKVNITDLNTKVVSSGGSDLYVMLLEIQKPSGLATETLRSDLEALKATLGVDITLQDIDAVSL